MKECRGSCGERYAVRRTSRRLWVVILNVRSSQGGVNRLRNRFEGLCAVVAQDLLQGVKSKLVARFVGGFENTVGGDEQDVTRLQMDGVAVCLADRTQPAAQCWFFENSR
jgi:hypothetical protein